MGPDARVEIVGMRWRPLLRLGAATAAIVVLLMPVQAAVFLLDPPPATVTGFFELFQQSPLRGLLALDLLLSIDYLVMVPLYLALCLLLWRRAPSWALLALVTGLFSVVLFLVSRDATFSVWMLSNEYAAAADDAERTMLLTTGQSLLTLYNGGTFTVSYLLGAVSALTYSAAMFAHRIFGRLPGLVGIITGLTMLVPPNIGSLGVIVAMLSLIPTAVWLILLARAFLASARAARPD